VADSSHRRKESPHDASPAQLAPDREAHPAQLIRQGRQPSIEQAALEEIIFTVAQEMLDYLGTYRGPGHPLNYALPVDDTCPECTERCGDICSHKTRRALDAGACRLTLDSPVTKVEAKVAQLIDHTLLRPDATRDQIKTLCEEAVRFQFASVCVNPWNVPQAAELLRGSCVKVCTVVGFPLGATLPQIKVYEAEQAIKLGAQEIDMVINVGALKSGLLEAVEADIRGVAEASHRGGAICKVILETGLLDTNEKIRGSIAAKNACADFVKTSTGFSTGGATAEDVQLMRAAVGGDMGVKASGGVRTLEDVKKMVEAGATRIGASASVKIIEQAISEGQSATPKREAAKPPAAKAASPASSSGNY
jgi:deoxyribose-phosphate aldolase